MTGKAGRPGRGEPQIIACSKGGHPISTSAAPGTRSIKCQHRDADGIKCTGRGIVPGPRPVPPAQQARRDIRAAAAKAASGGWDDEPPLAVPSDWELTAVPPARAQCAKCGAGLFWSPRGTMMLCMLCQEWQSPPRVRDRAAIRRAAIADADRQRRKAAAVAADQSPAEIMSERTAMRSDRRMALAAADKMLAVLDPDQLWADSPIMATVAALFDHVTDVRDEISTIRDIRDRPQLNAGLAMLKAAAAEAQPYLAGIHAERQQIRLTDQQDAERAAIAAGRYAPELADDDDQAGPYRPQPQRYATITELARARGLIPPALTAITSGARGTTDLPARSAFHPARRLPQNSNPGVIWGEPARPTAGGIVMQAARQRAAATALIERNGRCAYVGNHRGLPGTILGVRAPAARYAMAGRADQFGPVKATPGAPVIRVCGGQPCLESARADIRRQGYPSFVRWELT